MLRENQDKLDSLKDDTFFSNKSMNAIGREYATFLQSSSYYDLSNPEPVNLEKNTLSMALNYIRNIDNFVKKPIDEYTRQDMTRFIDAFLAGKIKGKITRIQNVKGVRVVNTVLTDKPLNSSNLKRHVHAFKRFWAVYRQYIIHVEKDAKRLSSMEWGLLLRAPKTKNHYENYPYVSINNLIKIADVMCSPEYAARVLLSINLMGRKCEVSQLRVSDIQMRTDDRWFIELPDVKKHSTQKVPVELYDYAKSRLRKYLSVSGLKKTDYLFPSKEPAFAKELKLKSEAILGKGKKITPKTLRKLGVCVTAELLKDKADVRTIIENVGGWSRNSPVLEHYLKRQGVEVSAVAATRADAIEHEDVYLKMDKLATDNQQMSAKIAFMEQLLIQAVKAKGVTKQSKIIDVDLLRQTYTLRKHHALENKDATQKGKKKD